MEFSGGENWNLDHPLVGRLMFGQKWYFQIAESEVNSGTFELWRWR
jgi:hypothetical protein